MSYCHQRDGLRLGSIADANESLRTATKQFGEFEVQRELTTRAYQKSFFKFETYKFKKNYFYLFLSS